jgi:elongation factor Ts
MISLELIKELRARTGGGIVECREALQEANGDLEKAITILRKKGVIKAAKKADRATGEGIITSYIHGNQKLGVLVSLRCETDFVARNQKFQELARNIAMHIAAADPVAISPDDIDPALIAAEREIAEEQVGASGKPPNIQEKIVAGKLRAFTEERTLLTQPYIKDPSITVGGLINAAVHELGENITVSEFKRLSI